MLNSERRKRGERGEGRWREEGERDVFPEVNGVADVVGERKRKRENSCIGSLFSTFTFKCVIITHFGKPNKETGRMEHRKEKRESREVKENTSL